MKVSIIIPVYNVSNYVERCLQSVMAQTYTDIECIIVDDCTPDDSIEKCEKLIAEYNGPICFKILHHEKNRGLSAARNTGIDAASSDYIFFLDSDDWLYPNCIDLLYNAINDDNSIEMVIGNYYYESDLVFPPLKLKQASYDCGLLQLYIDNQYYMMVWNKLYKRSFINQHHIRFIEGLIHEDIPWSFCCACEMKKMVVINDITYYYRVRDNSIQSGTDSLVHEKNYGIAQLEVLNYVWKYRQLWTPTLFHYITFELLYYYRDHQSIQKWYYQKLREYSFWTMSEIYRLSKSRKLLLLHIHRFLPSKIGFYYFSKLCNFFYHI